MFGFCDIAISLSKQYLFQKTGWFLKEICWSTFTGRVTIFFYTENFLSFEHKNDVNDVNNVYRWNMLTISIKMFPASTHFKKKIGIFEKNPISDKFLFGIKRILSDMRIITVLAKPIGTFTHKRNQSQSTRTGHPVPHPATHFLSYRSPGEASTPTPPSSLIIFVQRYHFLIHQGTK